MTRQDILVLKTQAGSYGEKSWLLLAEFALKMLDENALLKSRIDAFDSQLKLFGVNSVKELTDKFIQNQQKLQLAMSSIRTTVQLMDMGEDDGSDEGNEDGKQAANGAS